MDLFLQEIVVFNGVGKTVPNYEIASDGGEKDRDLGRHDPAGPHSAHIQGVLRRVLFLESFLVLENCHKNQTPDHAKGVENHCVEEFPFQCVDCLSKEEVLKEGDNNFGKVLELNPVEQDPKERLRNVPKNPRGVFGMLLIQAPESLSGQYLH